MNCIWEGQHENHNSIQQEINIRLNSGNVCLHSVQNALSFCLLSRRRRRRRRRRLYTMHVRSDHHRLAGHVVSRLSPLQNTLISWTLQGWIKSTNLEIRRCGYFGQNLYRTTNPNKWGFVMAKNCFTERPHDVFPSVLRTVRTFNVSEA
jgi:hypothetical protein